MATVLAKLPYNRAAGADADTLIARLNSDWASGHPRGRQ